jgi:hypothetical protein
MPIIAGVGERGLGWIETDPTRLAKIMSSLGTGPRVRDRSVTIPTTFSWRTQGKVCGPFDQGQTNTCTVGATAGAVYTACLASGLIYPGIPSPAITWRGVKAMEQNALLAPGASVTIPTIAIDDTSGCSTGDAVLWLARNGVAPMIVPQTPDGRFYDLWCAADVAGLANPPPANDTLPISIDELMTARQHTLLGPTFLNPADPNIVTDLKLALMLGPVLWGGYVGTQVFSYTSSSPPILPCPSNDPQKGGHCMVIQGWRPSILNSGTSDWEVQNSWSAQFGDNGYVWAQQSWAASASETYAMNTIRMQAAA